MPLARGRNAQARAAKQEGGMVATAGDEMTGGFPRVDSAMEGSRLAGGAALRVKAGQEAAPWTERHVEVVAKALAAASGRALASKADRAADERRQAVQQAQQAPAAGQQQAAEAQPGPPPPQQQQEAAAVAHKTASWLGGEGGDDAAPGSSGRRSHALPRPPSDELQQLMALANDLQAARASATAAGPDGNGSWLYWSFCTACSALGAACGATRAVWNNLPDLGLSAAAAEHCEHPMTAHEE